MIHVIDLKFKGLEKAIAAFLIESFQGPILVETGPFSTFPQLKAGIEKAGFDVEDIRHVLLTHIHLDHAGAAWAFAEHGASIYVHPVGAPHMIDPSRLMNSARRIYQEEMDSLWGDMRAIPEDQLQVVGDRERLTFGDLDMIALHTPGHAVHHIAWQADKVVFTGDVAGVKIDDGIVVPPCPPPDIDLDSWETSIEKIDDRAPEQLYLTHYGQVDDVEQHLEDLQRMLWDWAYWIKPHWENETDLEEITPKFQAYVRRQLEDAGVSGVSLDRYEAANPAWMSVAGLMRFWSKRK